MDAWRKMALKEMTMQQVAIAKPYHFVPPHHGSFWPWLMRKLVPGHTRLKWGVEWPTFRGLEHVRASLDAGHGVILAPNHCRPCDPYVLTLLAAKLDRPFYTMASWHLFMQGRLQRWFITRGGGFSVFREGLDREALKAATQLLASARRPIVIFPEGVITRGNDRLGYVMDGVAFIARSAAKLRAKTNTPGQVVIHPVAVRYTFGGDLRQTVEPILDKIERRIGWFPYRGTVLVERIKRLGEALLAVKEVEYFGAAQPGSRAERLLRFVDRLLEPLEQRYLAGRREETTIARIKKLRVAILPALTRGEGSPEEQRARWRHLDDCSFAQMLSSYPGGYIDGEPTVERLLETVERFEEDTHDEAHIHRPMQCHMHVGEVLAVTGDRPRGEADPLTVQLQDRLRTMLAASAHLCHPWKE
jgi:1-acyl-sn-glycerol-3-phosphate acyltransferase